jgi:hypothetical protein
MATEKEIKEQFEVIFKMYLDLEKSGGNTIPDNKLENEVYSCFMYFKEKRDEYIKSVIS